jgi:predicted ArsR family transcriptional regulator
LVGINRRFLETTRGQIVSMLRRGARTVDELAEPLGLTDNAIRSHLAGLERDFLIRQSGVRRTSGVGKPAVVYELHPDAEALFSRAYPPVLTTFMEALVSDCDADQTERVLRDVGRRLARQVGGRASGSLEARARAAVDVLTALGGDAEFSNEGGDLTIRGSGCPLSASVSKRPELCRAVETLIAEVAGADVQMCCEHGERPRCCFSIAGVD